VSTDLKTEKHGVLHRTAHCQQCSWSDGYRGAGDSIERVTRSARQHAQKHGHVVTVESGSAFTFRPA
jgi:hypothetical protein